MPKHGGLVIDFVIYISRYISKFSYAIVPKLGGSAQRRNYS